MSARGVRSERSDNFGLTCGREPFANGINMALLTEGGSASQRIYKHGPPDGGPNQQSSTSVKRCPCHASHF
jgi:hypothetical protein